MALERETLRRLLDGCEQLLKSAGALQEAPQATTASAASSKTPEEQQAAMNHFLQVHEGRGPLPFFGFNGGHFKLGANVWNYSDGIHQVKQPAHVTFMKTPIARVQVQRDQDGHHSLVDEGGLTWKTFSPEGVQKEELKPGSKKGPCRCESYHYPHRAGGGACRTGK